MIAAMVILAAASLLASGILFKHARILTLVAAAGALWDGQWLILTLIDRGWLNGAATESVYFFGAILLLLPWLFKYKEWSWPYKSAGSGTKDVVVLTVLVLVLGAAWLVQQKNGFVGGDWVTHGFYNGDTMTMVSLVQRSLIEDGLVAQNPFAGNESLEYPTLWHGGAATLLKGFGISGDWLFFLPLFTYMQIFFVVPMFFLLMDVFWPEPTNRSEKWLGVPRKYIVLIAQAGIIFYVMGVSWDGYIYPQTHFFLTGLFLLVVSLLVSAEKQNNKTLRWSLIPAGAMALALMLSNAVTGAAAVAVTVTFYGLKFFSGKERRMVRVGYALGILAWVVVYIMWSPGNAMFSWPHLSYTSAESLMRLAPIALALVIVILMREKTTGFTSLSVIVLMMMSMVTFLFSQRDIIVANAERFIYQGLLVGFPLLLAPLLWGCWQAINKWRCHTSGWLDKFVITIALLVSVVIVALPVLISGMRSHDHLMRQDRQIINLGYREVLDFIKENTAPDDVFLVNPNAPWALPMFTGRTMLRANYWLSPEDRIAEEVIAAFNGDESSQISSLQRVNYLVISDKDLKSWNLYGEQEVFHGGELSVFKTKD